MGLLALVIDSAVVESDRIELYHVQIHDSTTTDDHSITDEIRDKLSAQLFRDWYRGLPTRNKF